MKTENKNQTDVGQKSSVLYNQIRQYYSDSKIIIQELIESKVLEILENEKETHRGDKNARE